MMGRGGIRKWCIGIPLAFVTFDNSEWITFKSINSRTGIINNSVTDPGLPRWDSPTPKAIPSQKLHEIEKNWTDRERASLAPPPLESANGYGQEGSVTLASASKRPNN